MNAGRDDEEGDRHDCQPGEDRQAVGAPRDDEADRSDHEEQERRPHDDCGQWSEQVRRIAGRDDDVVDPCAAGREAVAVQLEQRPRVVGVHGQVRIAGPGPHDLADQPDEREPERCAERAGRGQRGDRARHEPARRPPVEEVAPDEHGDQDRDEDTELRFRHRGDRRPDRRPLGLVAPERPQAEKEEDDADRVDLAPDDTVEPGDRQSEEDRRAEQGAPSRAAQLEDHRVDQVADREIGQDRRRLDEIADPADRLPDDPHQPEKVEVPWRVVGEEAPLVEAERAMLGEVVRPELERVQVDAEPGARELVCDDDAEGEPEREKDDDRAGGAPRRGRPRWRSRAPIGLARGGASQRGRPPARALRWSGVYRRAASQRTGRRSDPARGGGSTGPP